MSHLLRKITPETLNAVASLDVPQRETVLRVAEMFILAAYGASKARFDIEGLGADINAALASFTHKIIEGRQREQSRAGFGTPGYDRAAALLRSLDAQAGISDNGDSLAGKRGG